MLNRGFREMRLCGPSVGQTYALFPPAAVVTAFGATSPSDHGLDDIASMYDSEFSNTK